MSSFDDQDDFDTSYDAFWIQKVLPTVLGLTVTVLGILYMLGLICHNKERASRVAAITTPSRQDEDDEDGRGRLSTSEAEQQYGPVACQAKLWGLQCRERQAILEHVFSRPNRRRKADHNTVEDCMEKGSRHESQHFDRTAHSSLDMRFLCAICLVKYGTLLY